MTIEELREKVLRYKAGEYVGRDIEDGYATEDICIVHTDDLDSLIAAARAEGADAERERIRKGGHPLMVGMDGAVEVYTVNASLLAPATKDEVKP